MRYLITRPLLNTQAARDSLGLLLEHAGRLDIELVTVAAPFKTQRLARCLLDVPDRWHEQAVQALQRITGMSAVTTTQDVVVPRDEWEHHAVLLPGPGAIPLDGRAISDWQSVHVRLTYRPGQCAGVLSCSAQDQPRWAALAAQGWEVAPAGRLRRFWLLASPAKARVAPALAPVPVAESSTEAPTSPPADIARPQPRRELPTDAPVVYPRTTGLSAALSDWIASEQRRGPSSVSDAWLNWRQDVLAHKDQLPPHHSLELVTLSPSGSVVFHHGNDTRVTVWPGEPATDECWLNAMERVRGVSHPSLSLVTTVGCKPCATTSMRYVVSVRQPSESLYWRLIRGGAMRAGEIAMIVRQVGDALDALHACGLTHGRLLASVVALEAGGSAKLSDLGAAQADAHSSPADDMGALAALTYAMLTGQPELRQVDAPIPVELARILTRALDSTPGYTSAGDFSSAVALALEQDRGDSRLTASHVLAS